MTSFFQVCGSVRSEPCTPLQCVGEALCPPEGSPACKNGTLCVGALPLSRRADDDVIDVKDRLGNLSVKITEATEMVHTQSPLPQPSGTLSTFLPFSNLLFLTYLVHFYSFNFSVQLQNTQDKTEEVRQLAMDLSSKTKKARDTLEEELKEMRNVVKELKDFLSGTDYSRPQTLERL